MTNLQDIAYRVAYDITDCESKSLQDIIDDISNSVKVRLTDEVKNKPLKCNITIVYSSIFEDKLNGDDDSKDMGQQRQ